MFKRLGKSRRHSADEIGCSLGAGEKVEEASAGNVVSSTSPGILEIRGFDGAAAALLRLSRNKYTRRSCGDAPTMQSLLATTEERSSTSGYQTVTAVPAFIVEHEPDKNVNQTTQKGSGITWGRRMSKKIESFRRGSAGSRESLCSSFERNDRPEDILATTNNNNNNNSKNNNNTNDEESKRKNDRVTCVNVDEKNKKGKSTSSVKWLETKRNEDKSERKSLAGSSYRSASPFKSFFIRMGSTGMLNSNRNSALKNRRSEVYEESRAPENLFRSCSTSQLNAEPSYVKCHDPSDGIDLRIGNRRDKTMSCDDLASRNNEYDEFVETPDNFVKHEIFETTIINDGKNEIRKPRIRNDHHNHHHTKETKKSNFPYAFLRSKLSVLPEERQQLNIGKDERIIKANSEERLPTLKMSQEPYGGVTTLGRRGGGTIPRNTNYRLRDNSDNRYSRNSYVESTDYSLDPTRKFDDRKHREESNERLGLFISESRHNEKQNSTLQTFDLDFATSLRNLRRNSAPCAERRLSSHYVSSNESGYDSDGPRGESNVASELDVTQNTKFHDGDDNCSVLDLDVEKSTRGSNNYEISNERSFDSVKNDDEVNGTLRWHRSASGRILPSIHHKESCENEKSKTIVSANENPSSFLAPHRARLQNEKSRFLGNSVVDTLQTEKIRRCRLVRLDKKDSRESLGIRLARQCSGEPRYIVVQLEYGGIAHRDGRLRLGDEIVRVEGRDLKTMDGLSEVQEFLKSFTGKEIRLVTAYDETLPRVFNDDDDDDDDDDVDDDCADDDDDEGGGDDEDDDDDEDDVVLDDASQSLAPSPTSESIMLYESSINERPADIVQLRKKRPDNLPVSSAPLQNSNKRGTGQAIVDNLIIDPSPSTIQQQQQQSLTRHVAKFQKGFGKPSLGFSVVGGRDSPRGEMGIFVRRVFPGGQADVTKSLFQGDEILSLNGKVLRGYTHQEVIELFKAVREGSIELVLARRNRYTRTPLTSVTY